MAGNKISALAQNTDPANNDYFVQVDVSDVSQAISGTTKKVLHLDAFKPVVLWDGYTAAPVINVSTYNIYAGTLLTGDVDFSASFAGTPYHRQKVVVEWRDDGTARTITWGTAARSTNTGLLAGTSVPGKYTSTLLIYNEADAIFDCVAVSVQA